MRHRRKKVGSKTLTRSSLRLSTLPATSETTEGKDDLQDNTSHSQWDHVTANAYDYTRSTVFFARWACYEKQGFAKYEQKRKFSVIISRK